VKLKRIIILIKELRKKLNIKIIRKKLKNKIINLNRIVKLKITKIFKKPRLKIKNKKKKIEV